MQPNGPDTQAPKSWGDFQARKLARVVEGGSDALSEALTQSIAIVKDRKKPGRKPKPPVEAKQATLGDLLRQAVDVALERRGRVSAEERVREQTLLEILTSAIKKAAS